MTIEAQLERIAAAIEALAAQGGSKPVAAKPAAKEEAPVKKAKASSAPSDDDLKKLVVTAVKEWDKAEEVRKILNGYKVKKAQELPDEVRVAFVAKVEALNSEDAGGDDDGDDDLI